MVFIFELFFGFIIYLGIYLVLHGIASASSVEYRRMKAEQHRIGFGGYNGGRRIK
jgi:hypothetical protein